MDLISVQARLADEVDALTFGPPVTHVYNPLRYAWGLHATYLGRFGAGHKEAVLLGMNPGPWGMAQTGVPFGEVHMVRDWMGLSGSVGQPDHPHPKRPIEDLDCTRSEVSGRRLWGWAAARFGTPEAFFTRFFVLNYCPLVFMESSGKNRTPDKLPVEERLPLEDACDRALRASIVHLQPKVVVGVGAWAEGRARVACAGLDVRFGRMLHPSPASPLANKGWAEKATAELAALGLM